MPERDDESRRILDQHLSDLLGFDDGVSDVVDHLLTIESSEDLHDYLTQLLGSDSPPVRAFVENVARYKRNEPLSTTQLSAAAATKTTTTAKRQQQAETTTTTTKSAAAAIGKTVTHKQDAKLLSNKATPSLQSLTTKKNNSKSSKGKGQQQQQQQQQVPQKQQQLKAPPSAATTAATSSSTIQKSHPPRGTAPFVCGCYGRVHPPLTNCLFCGRVACEKEGYNFCPFCGLLVEPVPDIPDHLKAQDEAWLHKERLLRYDREFAQRAVVLDDQADYYSKDSAWLTEEERAAAQEQEKEHQDEALRKRMQLNLVL